MTIKIKNVEYKLKYTIRAMFMFEQITEKPFSIKTLLDNYVFLYCIILANNPDNVLQWDDFLNELDDNPNLLLEMNKVIDEHNKQSELFEEENADDNVDNEEKKS